MRQERITDEAYSDSHHREMNTPSESTKPCVSLTCKVCNLTFLGTSNFKLHVDGPFHKKNLDLQTKKELPPQPTFTSSPQSLFDSIPPPPPPHTDPFLDMHNKIAYFPKPLIGLGYVTEHRCDEGQSNSHFYMCHMCACKLPSHDLIPHLAGLKHRTTYLKKHYPEKYQIFQEERIGPCPRSHVVAKLVEEVEHIEGRGKIERDPQEAGFDFVHERGGCDDVYYGRYSHNYSYDDDYDNYNDYNIYNNERGLGYPSYKISDEKYQSSYKNKNRKSENHSGKDDNTDDVNNNHEIGEKNVKKCDDTSPNGNVDSNNTFRNTNSNKNNSELSNNHSDVNISNNNSDVNISNNNSKINSNINNSNKENSNKNDKKSNKENFHEVLADVEFLKAFISSGNMCVQEDTEVLLHISTTITQALLILRLKRLISASDDKLRNRFERLKEENSAVMACKGVQEGGVGGGGRSGKFARAVEEAHKLCFQLERGEGVESCLSLIEILNRVFSTPFQPSPQSTPSNKTPPNVQPTPKLSLQPDLHSTPHSTSHSTSHSTPHSTSHSTPHSTLHSTPHSTPHSTSHSTLHSIPHSTLHSTPHSTPHSTLHSTLHSIPHSTLHSTSHSTLHSTTHPISYSTTHPISYSTIQSTTHSTIQSTAHSTTLPTSHSTTHSTTHCTIQSTSHSTSHSTTQHSYHFNSRSTLPTHSKKRSSHHSGSTIPFQPPRSFPPYVIPPHFPLPHPPNIFPYPPCPLFIHPHQPLSPPPHPFLYHNKRPRF